MPADNIESLIQQLGGCGRFQVLMSLACYAAELPTPWVLLMMAFGGYSPGMECPTGFLNLSPTNSSEMPMLSQPQEQSLKATSDLSTQSTWLDEDPTVSSIEGNVTWSAVTCDTIKDCAGDIRFVDSAFTVVTEWNLVCDRAWISSLIILVQMVGAFIGGFTGGYFANKYGRKVAIYLGLALCGVFNLLAAFSVSWYMFAVLRFFMGISVGTLVTIPFYFQGEFQPVWWRGVMGSFPDWSLASTGLALMSFALRDWRHLQIATAGLCFLVCLPAPWVPESMRWLVVHERLDKAEKVARKIGKLNKKFLAETDVFLALQQLKGDNENKNQAQQFISLFRKDLLKRTVAMGTIWLLFSTISYALNFGLKSLAGNFYINFIIMSLMVTPVRFVTQWTVNCLGRRWSCLWTVILATISSSLIVLIQLVLSAERSGMATTILALACLAFMDAGWGCNMSWIVELYPTTLRSLAFTWVLATTRIGSIVSPFIIQKEMLPLAVSFSIVAVLLIVIILCISILPETKGRPLTDVLAENQLVSEPMKSEKADRDYFLEPDIENI